MKWIKMNVRMPEINDLPFITAQKGMYGIVYELWEDMDWFQELEYEEQMEWELWSEIDTPDRYKKDKMK